jgi:NAD(P)H-flavin reductase
MATALGNRQAPPPNGALFPRPFRVLRRIRETHDTWTLALAPVDGQPLTPLPGQFTMMLAPGVGEVPISVSRGCDGGPLVHTIRRVGAVTDALTSMRRGDVIGIRGPYGTAWPLPEGADIVIVAGGIGLAPLRPAIDHVLAQRDSFGEAFLVYGARSPAELLFRTELERWRGRLDFEVGVTVDAAPPEWHGSVGLVTHPIPGLAFDPGSAAALVCGPEIMIRFVAAALMERGIPSSRIAVSLERNMRCGVGLCGHCQLGPTLICRDGPVYAYDDVEPYLGVKEL